MKKVGILTINDDNNYGNRLQNYAVQEILKKLNLEVETIINRTGKKKKRIKKIIKYVLNMKNQRQISKKYHYMKEFNKNIVFSKCEINKDKIPSNLGEQYDYFFTGSDQVWNPTWGRMSEIDFLRFASKEKRNSISASFGIQEIPEEWKEFYQQNLRDFHKMSVRETRGKELVKELIGREEVEVLIDPTMMLSCEEWDKVAKKPKCLLDEKKYILNYFLGELSQEKKEEIERVAKENHCEIINILNPKSPFYQTGPSEFVYLVKNAFLVCTDSFHSCVFSIIYNRPFIIFNREDEYVNMNSRIETLLETFQLKDRKFEGKITENKLNANYEKAYQVLKLEKKKMNQFIGKCLNNE